MMNKQEFIENIAEYINGDLSIEKAADFENAMNQDSTLKQAFEEEKEMIKALEDHFNFEEEKKEFEQFFEQFFEQDKPQTEAKPEPAIAPKLRLSWMTRAIAALFTLFLVVSAYWLYYQSPEMNALKLAVEWKEQTDDKTLINTGGTMGGTDQANVQAKFGEAKQKYENKEPEQALNILKDINTDDGNLLKALCYFDLKDTAKAEGTINGLLNSKYREQAEWLQALVSLQKDSVTKAKNQLEAIIGQEGSFAKEAQELLDQLNH